MLFSRLVLASGVVGLMYAPAASAKFISDIVPSTSYTTPETQNVQEIQEETDTPLQMEVEIPEGIVLKSTMTRAAFTSMVIEHMYTNEEIETCFWDIAPTLPPTFSLLYTDVSASNMYAKKLCVAMRDGYARGFKDGSFRPDQTITFAEASKILARAYGLTPYAEATNRDAWYAPYAYALAVRHAIPTNITTLQHIVTVGDTIEMLDRLGNDIRTRPSTPYSDIDARLRAEAMRAQREAAAISAKTVVIPQKPAGTKTQSSASSAATSTNTESSAASSAQPWYKLF